MKKITLSAAIAGASLLLAGQAFAAGYYVDEQSALRLGDAFSGGSASASDASAAFYGPASMILVKDQLAVNVAALPVTSKFTGEAKTIGGAPIQGGNAKTSTTDVLPTLYLTNHLDEDLAVGVYLNAPYATGSKFGKTSVARYQAADSEITGIDLGASFAARVNNYFTLGGGLIMQYMKAETGQAVNTVAACLGAEAGGEAPAGTCDTLGLGATTGQLGSSKNDGYFKMEGHNVAFGYQLGGLVEFSENSRLGFNYRSEIRHSIAGTASITGFPDSAALLGLENKEADGRVKFVTPEMFDLSYFHQLGDLSVQGTASWTNWHAFKELKVESRDQTVQMLTANPTQYNWETSLRFALGVGYQLNDNLKLRGGVAYDQSPIKDEFVKADFGFDDYIGLSVGASYSFTDNLFLDAGLQHTLKQKRNIDNNELNDTASWLKGEVTTEVTTVALGLRWLL